MWLQLYDLLIHFQALKYVHLFAQTTIELMWLKLEKGKKIQLSNNYGYINVIRFDQTWILNHINFFFNNMKIDIVYKIKIFNNNLFQSAYMILHTTKHYGFNITDRSAASWLYVVKSTIQDYYASLCQVQVELVRVYGYHYFSRVNIT